MVAERKYTDRDVRENESLRDLAINYVLGYGGDFEPLVNAVDMLKEEGDLPTNIIRVVLNCMRHDRNVAADLPQPEPARVVHMPRRRKDRNKDYRTSCGLADPHEYHTWRDDDDDMIACPGVPWPVNRQRFMARTIVNRPFASAWGGQFIHIVAPSARIEWLPMMRHQHKLGWVHHDPVLHVRTICRYPSVIKNPILFTPEAAVQETRAQDGRQFCPHCEREIAANINGRFHCEDE